jgi:hypothetical protein
MCKNAVSEVYICDFQCAGKKKSRWLRWHRAYGYYFFLTFLVRFCVKTKMNRAYIAIII